MKCDQAELPSEDSKGRLLSALQCPGMFLCVCVRVLFLPLTDCSQMCLGNQIYQDCDLELPACRQSVLVE